MTSSMFSLKALDDRPIHVVGQGSLGCPIGEALFRKSVPELHLWDFDVVTRQNLFNQRYWLSQVSESNPMLKVEARAEILRSINPDSPTKIVCHTERVVPETKLSGIVIAAVDWNRIRYQELWPCVKENPEVSFFADGRVGLDGGVAFGVDPNNFNHIYHYEHPRHNQSDPVNGEVEAACKSDFPMPENAEAVAAEVLWRITRWMHLEQGCPDVYDNFVGWTYRPRRSLLTEQWDAGTERHMYETREVIAQRVGWRGVLDSWVRRLTN
jgi:hypothetical protein